MKKLYFFLLIVLILSCCSAQPIREQKFSDLGYDDIRVSGINTKKCVDWVFKSDLDITPFEKNSTLLILSIHAVFAPVNAPGDPTIQIFFNDSNKVLSTLHRYHFSGEWARVRIPWELMQNDNVLKLCAQTSGSVNSLTIFSDSIIGNYNEVDFFRENGFVVSVEPSTIKVGEEFKVYVTLRNYGSRGTDVELRYRKETLDESLPYLTFLKGPTDYNAYIPPCEERNSLGNCVKPAELKFEYAAKSSYATEMTLLPAIVRYRDVFGDIVTFESNRKKIKVVEPEIKLKGFIIVERNIAKVGEKLKAKLALKNEGGSKIYNVRYEIKGNFLFDGNYRGEFSIVEPKEVKYAEFYINSSIPLKGVVGCSLEYFDNSILETNCSDTTLSYEAVEFDPALIGGLILLVIAIIIYLYIVKSK